MTDEKDFKTIGEALSAHCIEYGKKLGKEGLEFFTEEIRGWKVDSDQVIDHVPVVYGGVDGEGKLLMKPRLH